jgi:hypothetical protein
VKHKASHHKDRKKGTSLFGLGLAIGALGGIVVGHKLSTPRRMPHMAIWQRVMAEKRSEVQAAMLAARVQHSHDELCAARPHFAHRALRYHLERNILPGLALYHALREETGDQDAALEEWGQLFKASVAQGLRLKLIRLLGRLPDPFPVFRWANRRTLHRQYPPTGWTIDWLDDSNQCIAYNIYNCFYLNVLTAYDAPALIPLFCKLDDYMFEALPPTITWERTKTLGRGDDCCDFRWCRVTSEQTGPDHLGESEHGDD